MQQSEQNILSLLKSGNRYGLKSLFELYHQSLCVFALRFLDDFDEAEDVVQETFVQFWEKKHYNSVSSSLKSYLYMTVRNKSLRRLEQRKTVFMDEFEDYVDRMIEEKRDNSLVEERKEKLRKELDKLPEKSREVLTRIVFHGLKYKEVAEELDISFNTVKTQFSRALKQLRHSMDIIIFLMF